MRIAVCDDDVALLRSRVARGDVLDGLADERRPSQASAAAAYGVRDNGTRIVAGSRDIPAEWIANCVRAISSSHVSRRDGMT